MVWKHGSTARRDGKSEIRILISIVLVLAAEKMICIVQLPGIETCCCGVGVGYTT